MPTSKLELRHEREFDRLEWFDPSTNRVVDCLTIPSTPSGCAIEEFRLSPSGDWIVTARWSGQGEWGYDIIRSHPLEHRAGIPERGGYILDLPQFSPDESCVLGGYGENWLGGWWGHPADDFYITPARGGAITFGWIFEHYLLSQTVRFCKLQMNLPVGWIPEEVESDVWLGPRHIKPLDGGGVKMVLPGNVPFDRAGPLPDIIDLPVPNPAGGKLL